MKVITDCSVSSRGVRIGAHGAPQSLFPAGASGVWVDASDETNLFRTLAPASPLALPGQTVARIQDISGNDVEILQPEADQRPVRGRAPASGRRNLYQHSNQFGSAWTRFSVSVVQDGPVNPFGHVSWRVTWTGGSTARVLQNPIFQPLATYTASFVMKAGTSSTVGVNSRSINLFGGASFDLATGTVIAANDGVDAMMVDLGDGWYRCVTKFQYPDVSNPAGTASEYGLRDLDDVANASIFLSDAQVELGDMLSAYQRVGSQFDVTEPVLGLPALSYLHFDLINDVMPTVFADGGSFDLMIFGRQKSVIARNVAIAPGGSLNIGPASFPGGQPGGLAALGAIVGWVCVNRTLADNERDKLVAYHAARGAAPLAPSA